MSSSEAPQTRDSLLALEGAWVNRESNTHLYSRIINDELVTPYCFVGDDWLTGAYSGWEKIGEFWFARFRWLTADLSGFSFLKQESVDLLTGAWWVGDEMREIPEIPNLRTGVPIRWVRKQDAQIPGWALRFFENVQRDGIVNCLTRRSTVRSRD